jgi:hypothetical protein
MPAFSSGREWSKASCLTAAPGAPFSSFLAIESAAGVPFVNALATGFAMRDRLFGASPETSVYLFAEAAFAGIDDRSFRFGGILEAFL